MVIITIALCAALGLAGYLMLRIKKLSSDLSTQSRAHNEELESLAVDSHAATAKLKAVISNYAGVIWSVDKDGIITLFDGLFLKEIGVSCNFLEGKKLETVKAKTKHADIIENINKTFELGSQDWISEIDGRFFRSHTTLQYDESGEICGVVGSTDDITETLRLQRELEEALEIAAIAVSDYELAQQTVSTMFESNPHINFLFDSNFNVID